LQAASNCPGGATFSQRSLRKSIGPYDGIEDTLVGVQNLSGGTVKSITLSSKTLAIFGFDGDGLETFISPPKGGATGYEGAITTTLNFNVNGTLDTFSGISAGLKSGTLNFPGGLLNNGSAFFSLEEPLTAAYFPLRRAFRNPRRYRFSVRPWPALACYGVEEKRPDHVQRAIPALQPVNPAHGAVYRFNGRRLFLRPASG
jgi:hypothetical protein